MSDPNDSAKTQPDEPVPSGAREPFFRAPEPDEHELVTDPLALILGEEPAGGSLDLPEPILGSDEVEDLPPFGALDDTDIGAGALSMDEPPAFPADLAEPEAVAVTNDAAENDFDPAVASEPSDDADVFAAPAVAAEVPRVAMTLAERRTWRELRYMALSEERPEIEVPPPVLDEKGRLIRKYLFERSFDLQEAPPEPEPEPTPKPEPEPVELIAEEPPRPIFTEEEIAAARAAAFAEGEASARQAAMASAEARIEQLVEQIAAAMPGLIADRDQVVTAVSHEAARLAHAMVRRLMPELARRYRIEEIEAVVTDSLDKALDQPRIVIRTPADVTGYLAERLETVARRFGFAGRLVTLSDSNLAPSDVKIEWGDGGAERCIQRAWNDIEAIVARVTDRLEHVAPVAPIPPGAPEDTIGSAA